MFNKQEILHKHTKIHIQPTYINVIINELRNATSGRPNQPPDGAFEILVEKNDNFGCML